jgi:CRP-like cAMP-binding protein
VDRLDLRDIPLFSGFGAEAIGFLEGRLKEIVLEPGQPLATVGGDATKIFFVGQGWVRLLDASGKELARSGQGGVIGEGDALSSRGYSVGAAAVTKVKAWALPTDAIRDLVARFPSTLVALEVALGFRPALAVAGFADWLSGVDDLSGESREHLEQMAAQLQPLSLTSGQTMRKSLKSGLLLVEDGHVEVQRQGEGPEAARGCFVLVDWSLVSGGKASQSVRALSDSSAWYLPAEWCGRLRDQGMSVFAVRPHAVDEPAPTPEPEPPTVRVPDVVEVRPAPRAADVVEVPARTAPSTAVRPVRARAADGGFGGWLRGLSAGAKLRLAVGGILVIWLVAAGVLTLLDVNNANAADVPERDLSEFKATAVALTPVALAQEVVPTPTFAPSPTPLPTNTPEPTATPVPPTATPVPTDTPVPPTDTPEPTATATRRPPTSTPVPASNQAGAAEAQAEAAATPVPAVVEPTAAPAPSVAYRLASWRQLTPCENQGNHVMMINVIDPSGNGIPGVPLVIEWGGGAETIYTGQKMDKGPGWAEWPMYGGYTVHVGDGTSDYSPMLSSKLPEDQRCDNTNNNVANSFGHYSYEVIFQRTY